MDTYRGQWLDRGSIEDAADSEPFEVEDREPQVPVSPVGQDERRMQVRAYNHWASLLGNRSFPSIEDLEPEALPDFGPHSVLLDFTAGIDNPGIAYLGADLARECGITDGIETLDDVPSRSLLSRITDHYMQILANQAPIGFEAEFLNQRDRTILYRGILLPFSTDDDTIDFIYGVINWKEMADARTTDELLLEVDQAIERDHRDADSAIEAEDVLDLAAWEAPAPEPEVPLVTEPPMVEDPVIESAHEFGALMLPGVVPIAFPEPAFGVTLGLDVPANEDNPPPLLATKTAPASRVLPGYQPEHEALDDEDDGDDADVSGEAFGSLMGAHDLPEAPEYDEAEEQDEEPAAALFAALPSAPPIVTPVAEETLEPAAAEAGGESESLADTLALARELAHHAIHAEDRTRSALYAAIGRAYDVSLAAAESPGEFAAMIADAGLTVQDRAPMTPVVKLVFGADYDKTRLAEFASALSHAHRIGVRRGELAGVLTGFDGGLKQLVAAERKLRREEAGLGEVRDTPREALARKLRLLDYAGLDSVSSQGSEFTLLVARRLSTGEVVLLGEVAEDVPLLEKAARKLIG
jgi:hypothetical protein